MRAVLLEMASVLRDYAEREIEASKDCRSQGSIDGALDCLSRAREIRSLIRRGNRELDRDASALGGETARTYCDLHGVAPPELRKGRGCPACGRRLKRTPTEYTALRAALLQYAGLVRSVIRCPGAADALSDYYGPDFLVGLMTDRRIAVRTLSMARGMRKRFPGINARPER